MPIYPILPAISTLNQHPESTRLNLDFFMSLFRTPLTAACSALLAFGLASSVSAAPATGRAAAPSQPVDVQTMMIQRCASEMTALKITDATSAQKVCKCTIGVQATNLKVGEFWKIQSMAMNGQNPETLPAFTRVKPQLEQCRAGVKLNPPS